MMKMQSTKATFLTACAIGLFPALGSPAEAAHIDLGSSESFRVLAATTITNTGNTTVQGDIGVHPGTAITGFFGTNENDGPGVFTGDAYQGDSVAEQAQADAEVAWNQLAGETPTTFPADPALGGQVLTPGVYRFTSTALLSTGETLTLDGPGDYIFQVGSALTVDSDASMDLINGADAANVYWQIGSSATLGTNSDMAGTIIANSEAVTLANGAMLDGRAFSLQAAVTLHNNTIIPEPGSISLLALGSLLMMRRRQCGSTA